MKLHVQLLQGFVLLEPYQSPEVLDMNFNKALYDLLDFLLMQNVADL
jgi:uncharacterized protein involved in tolerance to divalent cations